MPDSKKFTKNSGAISDVLGEVLLTTIAVILVSSIAVFIVSYDGAADVPRTQVKEWMDLQADTLYLKHSGGEFIDTETLEVAVNINGDKHVYPQAAIYANLGNVSTWKLGDTIEIDTRDEWGIDITDEDEINVYLIDTPSKEIIQRFKFSSEEVTNSGWITPQGSAVDTSGGDATLLDVQKAGDGLYTSYYPPTSPDPSIYEEFNFGINPALWGFWPGDNITSVILKIVYQVNDNSCEQVKLKVQEEDTSKTLYEENLPEYNSFTVYTVDLSPYINKTNLANFKVRLAATGNANASAEKRLNIDYIAVHAT
ncbi:type IV pilin [Methanosarcina sp. KYL-1]|uniref:type IV pilin N-terminal domain-containing protein n=1 Tax=Methanosarcina sp. KYL-1 TaxID=2602068 RepID=UPI002101AE4B|nr:type IV pilin N-terminal domain-containing protein [Methanosarcina sp. KYL-1]MCQ1534704.1 type IV pilin [Methanosarcina sp. KYL-1]